MRTSESPVPAWHLRAEVLPHGHRAVDWWILNGRWTRTPIENAVTIPGAYALPGGLVDAHVHCTMNFGGLAQRDGSAALVSANLARLRDAGVLAIRDAGLAWGGTVATPTVGPSVQRAGTLMTPPGTGYPNICQEVEARDLVRTALDQVDRGAEWIKILGDFPNGSRNWFAAQPTYPLEVVKRLVREVHAAGARVMAHSTGRGVDVLVHAGVATIEHGMALTDELLREMADRDIAWVLTLATAHKHLGPLLMQTDSIGAHMRSELARVRRQIELAVTLNTPLLAGSDELPTGALATELAMLVAHGLTPQQAIAAASTTSRRVLGFMPFCEGATADLVTFDQDPRVDIGRLSHPRCVMVGGRMTRQFPATQTKPASYSPFWSDSSRDWTSNTSRTLADN